MNNAKQNISSVDNSLLVGQTDVGTVNDFLTVLLVSWGPARLQPFLNLFTVRLKLKISNSNTRNPGQYKHN